MKSKIIYYDFENDARLSEEEVREPILDPVLEQVRKELPPEHFEIYKRTIDDWMERNFIYQRENNLF